jgi:hypothetical protein
VESKFSIVLAQNMEHELHDDFELKPLPWSRAKLNPIKVTYDHIESDILELDHNEKKTVDKIEKLKANLQ